MSVLFMTMILTGAGGMAEAQEGGGQSGDRQGEQTHRLEIARAVRAFSRARR